MTKEAALHEFFNSFGIAGYQENNVVNENGEEDVLFPYLTYTAPTSAFEEGEVSLTVNLWYYGESEAPINAKARELSKRLGQGGTLIACDEGTIWLKRGSPFSQPLRDEVNPMIKRRYINVTAEYMTPD